MTTLWCRRSAFWLPGATNRILRSSVGVSPRLNKPLCRSWSRDFAASRSISSLRVADEVADAVKSNKPVVALESTIYTHGALGDDLYLEDIVREHGAVPAVCGVLAGVPTVGLSPSDITRMVDEGAKKVSRRDLAYVVGMGGAGKQLHGGTTIAGTMILARLAGIRVFGTGGLGGVHRGGENSLDVSADLTELGRTRMAVIASGCKGFLDIPRTLEYLETQGVLVSTFADGRNNEENAAAVDFPAFWARESGVPSPSVVHNEAEAAAMIVAQERLSVESGLLFANPIPVEHSIPRDEMDAVIAQAVREADEQGFTGNRNTPYILRRIRELTDGRSVPANKALVQANVARAAKIAVEVARLLEEQGNESRASYTSFSQYRASTANEHENRSPVQEERDNSDVVEESARGINVLVAGSVAWDLSCDYAGDETEGRTELRLHTSNPGSITRSIGGVGFNVALAATRVSEPGKVELTSLVGGDQAGSTILQALRKEGLSTFSVKEWSEFRTAQYVSINDSKKNLVVAIADMDIFCADKVGLAYARKQLGFHRPKWFVADANWSVTGLRNWLHAAQINGARTAFEPTSVEKAARLFCAAADLSAAERRTAPIGAMGVPIDHHAGLGVFPRAAVDLATPNIHELASMYVAASRNGYFDFQGWFEVIDSFRLPDGGATAQFTYLTSAALVKDGVPQMMVKLLPYMPTLAVKLGADGVLVASILPPGDPLLEDAEESQYILGRNYDYDSFESGDGDPRGPPVGGVYMRLFPVPRAIDPADVVSVNGVGDTFLGVLVAGLAQGARIEDMVNYAQTAAALTLQTRGSVAGSVGGMKQALTSAAEKSQSRAIKRTRRGG